MEAVCKNLVRPRIGLLESGEVSKTDSPYVSMPHFQQSFGATDVEFP